MPIRSLHQRSYDEEENLTVAARNLGFADADDLSLSVSHVSDISCRTSVDLSIMKLNRSVLFVVFEFFE
jgi:hypothetical protein